MQKLSSSFELGLLATLILALAMALPVQGQSQYFPLTVGDWWTYNGQYATDTSYLYQAEIQDPLTLNGQEYFVRATTVTNSPAWGYKYFRADSAGNVYQYDATQEQEYLWYRFDVAAGDSYQVVIQSGEFSETWSVHVTSETVVTPAGTFTDCIRLFFDIPEADDDEHWSTWAPGVGRIRYGGAWQPDVHLYRANVGGVRYEPTIGTTNPAERLPQVFILNPNYPNPFNAGTTIEFATDAAISNATLIIYDLLGKSVITLADHPLVAGYYSLTWDGTDSWGRELASGIYIAQLKALGLTRTRRLVLLR